MSRTESFLDKEFDVADPDTRLRIPNDLMEFDRYKAGDKLPSGANVGDIKKIPVGTKVRLDALKSEPSSSTRRLIFAHALAADGSGAIGWTSTRNFKGKFLNETLGVVSPKPGAGKFGPNASWKSGSYAGQVTLVEIMGGTFEIEQIVLETLDPYLMLVGAAAEDGIVIELTDGFRTYADQKYLHEGWTKKLKGFNNAAPPGTSRHQNGIAFDIEVAGGTGNPTYDWLVANATNHGYLRTVSGEPWHWEYDPTKAKAAKKAGTYKAANVTK